jgi:hypothetical protein
MPESPCKAKEIFSRHMARISDRFSLKHTGRVAGLSHERIPLEQAASHFHSFRKMSCGGDWRGPLAPVRSPVLGKR